MTPKIREICHLCNLSMVTTFFECLKKTKCSKSAGIRWKKIFTNSYFFIQKSKFLTYSCYISRTYVRKKSFFLIKIRIFSANNCLEYAFQFSIFPSFKQVLSAGVMGQIKEFIQSLSKEQREALAVLPSNIRKYLKHRSWSWWKLWQKVKPLLDA